MRIASCTLITISILISISCHTSKKGRTSTAAIPPVETSTVYAPTISNAGSSGFLAVTPNWGMQMPDNDELIAIKLQYKDATMDLLKDGYFIYTKGACINCHEAKSIYTFKEAEWKYIIEDMAQKADINNSQKDAVYKYVMSVKATQPK